MDLLEEFDHVVVFDERKLKAACKVKADQCMNWLNSAESVLLDALSDRVRSVQSFRIPLRSKSYFLAIGLKLNSSVCNSAIIRGPRSGTEGGKLFQEFWGAKAEIRHLDGDLFECVIWDASKAITSQIVDYVLQKKFNFDTRSGQRVWHHVSSTRLAGLLKTLTPAHTTLRLPMRASVLHLIRSLDQLNSVLCSFNKHLPLNVMGVQALSAEFRGTSVFAPVLIMRDNAFNKAKSSDSPWHNVHHTLRPIYALLNIETSGKWPRDNYQAFLHMKRLFLLRIKELLTHLGIPSRVVATGMLDILLNGVILRVSFSQSLELTMLRRSLGLIKPKSFKATEQPEDESLIIEPKPLARWLLFYQRLPDVVSQLVTIARSHIHTFPDACRLAKRWLSAHGFPVIQCPDMCDEPCELDSQPCQLGDADLGSGVCRLTEIAVELMIVHAGGFTRAVETPGYFAGLRGATEENFLSASPLATFLRFLRLLYSFDWQNDILLVDLNEGFSDKDGREKASTVVTNFKLTPRATLPSMVIATPLDPAGTHWTLSGPSAEGLKRLQELAVYSHELLRAMLVAGAKLSDLKAVFRPDLSNLDVLIKLRPSVYKTRILEAVDLEVPSWAMKTGGIADKSAEGKCTVTTEESEPVSMDLPNPGAKFWPNGYLCDPVIWIMRQIQMRLKPWDIFDYTWDRHCGRWIGLRIKDADRLTQLQLLRPFSASSLIDLNGFACHRQSADASSAGEHSMSLLADFRSAFEMLTHWGAEMIECVRVQNVEAFQLSGFEVSVTSKVVALETVERDVAEEGAREDEVRQECGVVENTLKRRLPAKPSKKKRMKKK